MTNPLLDIWQPASARPKANPLDAVWSAPQHAATPDDPDPSLALDTAKKRLEAEQQSMIQARDGLKAIVPKDAGHKARLDRMINSLDMQIADRTPGRSALENFVRGTAAGVAEGAQFPVELAGNVLSMFGSKDLQNYIEENRALIKEDLDPEGTAGTVGEVAGNILGSAPAAGGAAELAGRGIIRLAPSTRIARAIAAAAEGTMGQRVAANVVTGLPITVTSALGAPEMDIPEGASDEERARISQMNVANKIKNLAIGIGADALFGAIPHGKAKAGDKPVEVPPADVLTPERQAQLDQVAAKNAVKVAAKRRERLDKSLAQSEWQILNPDMEWKELQPTAKRKIYDDFRERRRNSNPNTSTDGNPPEYQQQLVNMEEQIKALQGERDDARRMAETDPKLNIGNARALERAAASADKDPNLAYIFADANGQKAINDALGYEAGDKFLADARDAMLAAHEAYGVKPRIFRYGGDELVAIVPKEHAETILNHMETNSVKQYGNQTGSLSGAISETLPEALSIDGKAKLTSRKLEAKAKQGIPGRNAEEQALIDAARERINTQPTPVQQVEDLSTAAGGAPDAPLPPEAMEALRQVHGAGGLQSDESIQAFTQELTKLYNAPMEPKQRASELQSLVEDFTPFEPETPAAGPKGAESPTPTPPAQAAPPEAKTTLESVDHSKPLEKMTDKELSRIDDKLTDAIESVDKGSAEHAVIQRDFDAVRNEYARRNAASATPAAPVQETPRYGAPELVQSDAVKQPDIAPPRVPEEVAKLRRMSPRKMSSEELELYIQDHETIRRNTSDIEIAADAQKRIDKALEERALRDKASNAVMPQVQKSAIQGTAGFAFGFSTAPQNEDNTDRTTNALTWALVAATGGLAIARMHAKVAEVKIREEPSDHWLGSEAASKKIVNYEDVEDKSPSWRERAREWYQGIVRRTHGIDNAVNMLTGNKAGAESLAAHKNPAKLASMFGRWVSMAEGALMDKPIYMDYAGNPVPLSAPSYREIADMVDGDLKGLGKLMTARASIEGQGLRSVPLDPVTADLVFHSAPEKYHRAADAMRQFDLSMVKVLENSGVLSPGSADRMATEEFYAGLKKVFDPDGGPSKIVRDPKTKKLIISTNPVKGRKQGNSGQVYNPAETTASMVPQVYRSAELNEIKSRLVDLWEAAGKPDHILKQVERRKLPISVDQQLRIDALKQEIKGLSQADAESLVAAFDPKSLDPRSNVMTVYRDGVLRAYRVDEDVAQSMSALTPDELEGVWKVLGLPAGIAKQGVVMNPYFVAKQSFIDGWQAMLNSQYGFRPGVDQFIGWYNIVRHTPEYQSFIAAGGGHSTLQSHNYANVKTALQAVKTGGGGPLETAVKQVAQLKLIDAWRTLIVPFAESARVGEYLRARDHGASPLDALYAAKHVTANFQQRGGFTAMRGLDRASMFLNPAIQGLDQALFRAGANPFRVPEEGRKAAAAKYLSKAFVGITLPSMYFWFMNKDDQEINDLRKTPSGAKYWFMRSTVDAPKMGLKKGDIVKIPKPIVDGQVFGTSMESYLDKAYGNDPAQMSAAAGSIAKDISFNLLPTAGVLYYGLQFNKNVPLGSSLIPQGDENLSPEHQGEDKASWVSRVVSQKITPLVGPNTPDILKNATTPAGLDYVMNTVGGMLGQDGLLAIGQAVEAETKGYVPAKEELPVVSKVFAAYPTSNVAPIRRFYDRASQVQTVGATINHLVREDPARLLTYMGSNQSDYILLGLFTKARQDIANYRRAYQDVKDMPAGAISNDDRRSALKQYQVLMIETARQVNAFADEVDRTQGKR